MTLNELIYDIYELLEINADDSTVDDRYVETLIYEQRALWLRNEYNKNRTIDQNVIQELGCVEIIQVDKSECCEAKLGCTILRTKNPIPNTIEFNHDNAITRVGPVDITHKAFKELLYPKEIPFFGNGRTNKDTIGWFLKSTKEGLHIYLITNSNPAYPFISQINISGVWENPREAARYKNCEGKPCWDPSTSKYPLNAWMWNYIRGEVAKLIELKIRMPQDLEEDNKDNVKPQ